MKIQLCGIYFFVFFFIEQYQAKFLDYSNSNFTCNKIQYQTFYPQDVQYDVYLQQNIKFHLIDQYIFIILGSINIILTLSIILTQIIFPYVRKQVGSDIIVAISISELILAVHWFSQGIYYLKTEQNPYNQDFFCEINYTFSVYGVGGEYLYNFLFAIVIYFKKYGSQRQVKWFKPQIYHSIVLAIISISYLILVFSRKLGLNFQGTCSIKGTLQSSIFGTSMLTFFMSLICIIVFMVIIFQYYKNTQRSRIKLQKAGQRQIKGFMMYYMVYVISISICWSMITISNLIVTMNCFYDWDANLYIFISISNFFKVLGPLILSFVRFSDPKLKLELIKIFRKKSKLSQEFLADVEDQLFLADTIAKINSIFIGIQLSLNYPNQDKIKIKEDSIRNVLIYQETQFLDNLLQNKFYLECVCQVYLPKQFNKLRDLDQVIEFEQSFDLKQNVETQLIQFYEIQNENPFADKSFIQRSFLKRSQSQIEKTNEPQSELIQIEKKEEKDQIQQNKNLSENNNRKTEQFKFSAVFQGEGKSGANFYLTFDRNVLIKTIKNQEIEQIVLQINNYLQYLQENPKSFINPIKGIFKFSNPINESFMIQSYLTDIPSQYILRKYDLKGSQYKRTALENFNLEKSKDKEQQDDLKQILNQNQSPSKLSFTKKVTLKDNDFQLIEGKIILKDVKETQLLRQQMIQDTQFLSQMEWIDYSLLAFKVDLESYRQHEEKDQSLKIIPLDQYIKKKFEYQRVYEIWEGEQEENKGHVYFFGIIDYLQKYDIRKWFENNLNLIKNFEFNSSNQFAQHSCLNPIDYSLRFIQQIIYENIKFQFEDERKSREVIQEQISTIANKFQEKNKQYEYEKQIIYSQLRKDSDSKSQNTFMSINNESKIQFEDPEE